LVTALEGGSNYWYTITSKYPKDVHPVDFIINNLDKELVISDVENKEVLGSITYQKCEEGLILLKEQYPDIYENCMDEESSFDADDADIFLQLVVMKEVVYG
jgi:hypothetical protein